MRTCLEAKKTLKTWQRRTPARSKVSTRNHHAATPWIKDLADVLPCQQDYIFVLQTDEYTVVADPGILLLLIWHQHQPIIKDLVCECLATNTGGVEIFKVFKTFMTLTLYPKSSVWTSALMVQSNVGENGRHLKRKWKEGHQTTSNHSILLCHTLSKKEKKTSLTSECPWRSNVYKNLYWLNLNWVNTKS